MQISPVDQLVALFGIVLFIIVMLWWFGMIGEKRLENYYYYPGSLSTSTPTSAIGAFGFEHQDMFMSGY